MANDKYLEVITSQHRDKPNFIAWLSQHLDKLEGNYNMLKGFPHEFDIDTAVGNQLDVIGELVGRARKVDFQPTDGSSPILDDDTYRLILKAKVLRNLWDGTIEGMTTMFDTIFPDFDLFITDNQDMTIKAMIIGVDTPLQINLLQEGYFLPKPAGVTVSYEIADIVNNNLYLGIVFHEGCIETINQVV